MATDKVGSERWMAGLVAGAMSRMSTLQSVLPEIGADNMPTNRVIIKTGIGTFIVTAELQA